MLDVSSITAYLLRNNIVSRDAVVEDRWSVHAGAGHERTLRVDVPNGPGCFIKQPPEAGQKAEALLLRERKFYAFCHHEPSAAAVAAFLPRLLAQADDPHLLVLELFRDAVTLWSALGREEAGMLPVYLARATGGALATIHGTFREMESRTRPDWLSGNLPWGMRIHQPRPAIRATLSTANAEMLHILQTEGRLSTLLDQLPELWQPDTIIHNDVKMANVLILPARSKSTGASDQVRIIDWEHVQMGDPAWDVAGAFQDFVHFWIMSMPLAEPLDADAIVSRARYPLAMVQPVIRSFWEGYRTTCGLSSARASRLLSRAVRFSAARLIQTAYEWGAPLYRIPKQSVLLLQVSANLLNNPESMQSLLYGIPSR
jgi:Ser/Thr protein kinase RdoA (MazF antagonist)